MKGQLEVRTVARRPDRNEVMRISVIAGANDYKVQVLFCVSPDEWERETLMMVRDDILATLNRIIARRTM